MKKEYFNNMKIEGKNIILTGASSGIGLELLNILTTYTNVKIMAVARNIETIPAIDNVVYPFSADASKPEEIDKIFEYAQSTLGIIDIFIANAGFGYLERLENANWEHIEKIFSLNVFSPIYSLEKLTKTSDKPKAFVCTISAAGLVPLPYYSLYCSTKAALNHFIETFRYEKNENLQITAIYPIATRTRFFDKAAGNEKVPLPFLQQNSKVVARKIIKGIEKNKRQVSPSALFRIFYPIGRIFPFLLKIYSKAEKKKIKEWKNP